ncbi:iron-containing redox enzyme family protein [Streptomyces marianii]|uniref:iron-containing redox enzyme family protein n=1 Tax=Streptomyces marianii TaxID=1817406 RepID=UPI001485F1BE|nr:iron-containing redox enzyme family protein [Streptomyces marianii]
MIHTDRRANGNARCAPGGLLRDLRRLDRCSPQELSQVTRDYTFRAGLAEECRSLTARGYEDGDHEALAEVHAALAFIRDHDFSPVTVDEADLERQPILRDVAALLEGAVLDHELSRIPESAVTGYPGSGPEYVRWLKAMVSDHPAGWHPLYHEYLPESGEWEDLRLLLAQETSLDPRFDDILALMQVGRQGGEKLEIAANYWDEMGNGDPSMVHTSLFGRALEAVGADAAYVRETLMPEAVVAGNVSACLALSRRHYYKAVGYFGVTEYLAPRRFRRVVDTWRRHDLDEVGIVYHDLHIGVDAGHAAGWFRNVVGPLVSGDPRTGREIALGAMIRLNTSRDYLDALLDRMRSRPRREAAAVAAT